MSKKQKSENIQKKKDINEKQNTFYCPEIPKTLQHHVSVFNSQCSFLYNHYVQFKQKQKYQGQTGVQTYIGIQKMFEKWMSYYIEACKNEMQAGTLIQIQMSNINLLYIAPNESVLFKSYNFFIPSTVEFHKKNKMLKNIWTPRFETKFLQKINELNNNQLQLVYSFIQEILNGRFQDVNVYSLQYDTVLPFSSLMRCQIYPNRSLLFIVLLERLPILNKNSDKCEEKEDYVNNNWTPLFIGISNGQKIYYSFQYNNDKDKLIWGPNLFQSDYLTSVEQQSIVLDKTSNRWIEKSEKFKQENIMLKEFQFKLNKQILDQYADFKSAGKLVELLQKIPNFKIRLTKEELDVVGQDGNVMVIGRSGTGKTTCAILRLFTMELLFKIRVQLYKNKNSSVLRDTRFTEDDMESNIGLHCLFVTASPVLTNEIRRYYQKLTDQIKEQLKAKQEKVRLEKLKEKQKQKQQQEQEQLIIQLDDDNNLENQMEEELKDIELKHQVSHESQEQAEQELIDKEEFEFDEEEIQQKMNTINSLNDMKEKDFPGFLTVRSLLMMIDACLFKPFFARNLKNEIIGVDKKSIWHNEQKGVLMIDNYYKKIQSSKDEKQLEIEDLEDENESDEYQDEDDVEEEYRRLICLQQKQMKKQKQVEQEKKQNVKKLSFEVDFKYFETHFWPRLAKRQYSLNTQNVQPSTVWNEIFSYIKGSAMSHTYMGWYMTKYVYMQDGDQKRSFLNLAMRENIYSIFQEYEVWKLQVGGYDMMDLVNYILVQIKYKKYSMPPIHYMMVDEVQDLPHAVLLLLMKLTEQGLFFAGDTAQTIAQGVGFRFCDLRSIFDKKYFEDVQINYKYSHQFYTGKHESYVFEKPTVKQLTVNFRSHNNILQLANSVVSCLEIFFPRTIDKLNKEKSNIDGPKPIILNSTSNEILFFILCGEEAYKNTGHGFQNQNFINRNPLEFGCNQAILVRTQEAKENLPSVLQQALCLTIYESKGLEFDDVILYNFFNDSTLEQSKWALFKTLQLESEWVDKDEYLKTVTIHDWDVEEQKESKENKDQENQILGVLGVEESQDKTKVLIRRAKCSKKVLHDYNVLNYSQLCLELKQLYVAVTRARNRLIIYDDNQDKRMFIQKYWNFLNNIEEINEDVLQQASNQQDRNESREMSMYRSILTSTSQNEWKQQGLKMFKHKFFEQAMKCFQKANENDLYTRAKAYLGADNASKMLIQIDAEREYIKQGWEKYANQDKKQKKITLNGLKAQENQTYQEFYESGQLFLKFNKIKQAAQCFFTGKFFQQAAELYLQEKCHKQAGEAFYMLGKYLEAAEQFDIGEDYIRTIESYAMINNFEKILETLNKYQNVIPVKDKEIFIRKFAPLAFEELVQSIEKQNQIIDIQVEEPNKQIDIIEENVDEEEGIEDSDEEEDEEEEEKIEKIDVKEEQDESKFEQINSDKDEKIQKSKEQVSVQEISFEVVQKNNNVSEISFENIQDLQSQNQEQKPEQTGNVSEMSFDIVENSRQQSQPISFDHLSHVDLEQDEWLKMEKGSVVDSISEARKQNSQLMSEYSAVEFNEMLSPHMQLVKSKLDIFIQDTTMQKIIRYISMFSQEFQKELKLLRSSKSMLTHRQDLGIGEDIEYEFMIDLDNVDTSFIYLILDTLEAFKIYKLCIFVCNRYRLTQRLGRYVLSLSHKYSILANNNSTITHQLVQNGQQRMIYQEKAFVASIAIHNILENINPEFLRPKKQYEQMNAQNSLGIECYQQLIILGYWKKALYQIDYENALALASAFGDFKNYKIIFLTHSKNYKISQEKLKLLAQNQVCFDYLPFETPQNIFENEMAIICLEHYIETFFLQLSKKQGPDFFVNKFYREEIKLENNQNFDEQFNNFPSYFKHSGILFQYMYGLYFQSTEKNMISNQQLIQCINEAINSLSKILILSPEVQPDINETKIYDLIVFVTILSFIQTEWVNFQDQNINDFLDLLDLYYKLYGVLNQSFVLNKHTKVIVRAILSVFKIRLISDSDILKLINNNHVFVHRGSIIINDLINFNKFKKENIEEADRKVANEIYFSDIDHQYIACPLDIVITIVKEKIQSKVLSLINLKIQNLSSNEQKYITREQFNLKAYKIATIMALKQFRYNFELRFNNKRNIDKSQLPKYMQFNKNDVLRKYLKLESEMQEIDPYSSDEELYDEMFKLNLVDNKKNKIKKHNQKRKIDKGGQNKGQKQPLVNQQPKKEIKNQSQKSGIPQEKTFLNQLLANNIGQSINKVHRYVRDVLLILARYYISQSLFQTQLDHRKLVKVQKIFMFLGENYLFYEIYYQIRKEVKKELLGFNEQQDSYMMKTFKAFRSLDYFVQSKEYGLTEDYADYMFDYFESKFRILKPHESIQTLEEAVINFLVAQRCNGNKKTLKLSQCYLKYIPNLKFKEFMIKKDSQLEQTVYTHISYSNKADHEFIDECLFWIQQLFELNIQMDAQEKERILILVANIILNIDNYDSKNDFRVKIQQTIDIYNEQNDFKSEENEQLIDIILKCQSSQQLLKAKNKIYDIVNLQDVIDVVEVIQKENTDNNYDNSFVQQIKDWMILGKRISAKRKIMNFFKEKQQQFSKTKQKLISNPVVIWNLSQFINQNTQIQYLRNINYMAQNYGSLFQLFQIFEVVKRDIINTYYQTYIENALDFHFIALFMKDLSQQHERFSSCIHDCLGDNIENKIVQLKQLFIEIKKDVEQQHQSFQEWKLQNVNLEANVKKLLDKNRKFLMLKWKQQGSGIDKMAKIKKKIAGQKKLRALEIKKMRLKN